MSPPDILLEILKILRAAIFQNRRGHLYLIINQQIIIFLGQEETTMGQREKVVQ